MDIFLANRILNEAYFGKTKELLAMEKTLGSYRRKYYNTVFTTVASGCNSDPELLKFDRMVEDYFGFGCFMLEICAEPVANAFTIPVDMSIDYKGGKPLANAKTYKFNKEYDYGVICGIYSGVIFNKAFTDEEVMATILHEIGHNFNSALSEKPDAIMMRVYTAIRFTGSIYNVIKDMDVSALSNVCMSSNACMKWSIEVEKNLRTKHPFWSKGMDLLNDMTYAMQYLKLTISDFLRVSTLGLISVLSAGKNLIMSTMYIITNPWMIPISHLNKTVRTKSEKTADNFATMYGYGPALTTALAKMETTEGSSGRLIGVMDKIPVVGTLMHIIEVPAFVIGGISDEHPGTINRAYDQMALLRKELQKADLDPKMKRRIQADLVECEAGIDALTDTSKGFADPYLGNKAYNKFIANISKSDNFSADQEKRFATYDDVLKQS